jgi:hypothetical protein
MFLFAGRVLAQADCPTIVAAALETTHLYCADLARNEICYGNTTLEAEPQPGVEDFIFERSGDIVPVTEIRTLRLFPMDNASVTWGVALMQLQAGLPDNSAENVTIVLFDEVNLTHNVLLQQVTASSNINVRGGPSTNDEVIGSLRAGETVYADGRNADSTWRHIQLDDGGSGWVFAELVTLNVDANTLPVVDGSAPETPSYAPMQAFTFTTGMDDAPCEEAPDSGILIQTPAGVGEINLLINEVEIRLGSTAYLQAQASGEMTVNVIEGEGRVTAFGTSVSVPEGTRARIPLDENGVAADVPEGPEAYEGFDALPLVLLPRMVTIADPLVVVATATPSVGGFQDGSWMVDISADVCVNSASATTTVTVEGGVFVYDESSTSGFPLSHLPRFFDELNNGFASGAFTIPGSYTAPPIEDETLEFTTITSTLVEAQLIAPTPSCTVVDSVTMQLND